MLTCCGGGLKVPWRERFPHCHWRAQQRHLRDQGCRSRRCPKVPGWMRRAVSSIPRYPHRAAEGEERPGGRASQRSASVPLHLGEQGGAEKGAQHPKYRSEWRRQGAPGDPAAAAGSLRHAQPGFRLARAGRRETKQNNNNNKKKRTETNQTPEECNATTPSWRALRGGGWRSWVSMVVNSFRVIPPSTLPCNSDPSVEV